MNTVISFFNDETKADKAVSALTQSKFEKYSWEVITSQSGDVVPAPDLVDAVPVVNSASGYVHAAGAPAFLTYTRGLGLNFNDDEARYFSRLLDQGGTLVIVKDVAAEDEQALVGFLNELGGKSTDND